MNLPYLSNGDRFIMPYGECDLPKYSLVINEISHSRWALLILLGQCISLYHSAMPNMNLALQGSIRNMLDRNWDRN